MTERIGLALFFVFIAYCCAFIASGFIDFALQWFTDFRLRPYISIPLNWLFGVIGGVISSIVNAVFSSHSKAVLGFSLVSLSLGIAPHLFFRFVILPMQISYRWLVTSIYISMFVFFIGYQFFDRSIWDIFISTLVYPMTSGRFTDGIARILNNEFSIAFLLAMILSQIIGYFIVRRIRYVNELDSRDASDAAGQVMQLTTLFGRKMGYIKTTTNSENSMHWAIQKGNQVVYPFFPGLGGGSSSGEDVSVDFDL